MFWVKRYVTKSKYEIIVCSTQEKLLYFVVENLVGKCGVRGGLTY